MNYFATEEEAREYIEPFEKRFHEKLEVWRILGHAGCFLLWETDAPLYETDAHGLFEFASEYDLLFEISAFESRLVIRMYPGGGE